MQIRAATDNKPLRCIGPAAVWLLLLLTLYSSLTHTRLSITTRNISSTIYLIIYVKKLFSLYRLQCKGDIVVVDIKQHKSQFKNLNFTITQSPKFF